MAENRISYLNRTYDEYRDSLMDITKKYYPKVFRNLDDASVGQWFIELVSDVGDNLQYAIDRTYQETRLDSASLRTSLLEMAKNLGLKIPGPKSAIVEVELSADLPLNTSLISESGNNLSVADENYAPIVRRGTLFSNGSSTFELMEDVNFAEQFDKNGISNRQIIPLRNSNGSIVSYRYKKLAIAVAGQSKVHKRTVSSEDIEPFMSFTLQDSDVTNVESIILKQGTTLSEDPSINEFYVDRESYEDKTGKPTLRFFEVDNLIDQYRFGYDEEDSDLANGVYYNPVWDTVDAIEIQDEDETRIEPIRIAMRGRWKRLKNKFITEFDESGNLKVMFGAGLRNAYGDIPTTATEFTQYMMTRMEANDFMGVLPEPNTTMFVLYRVGGGEQTNIAANSLTNIIYLNMYVKGNCDDENDAQKKSRVKTSIKVNNPSPSYGGRNTLSNEEIKMFIKYNAAAQNRCVTLHDYYTRLMQIEPKYGLPFRYSVAEENNKVVIYTLGLDYLGKLSNPLAERVADNMKEYLSMYKMINDIIEVRSGRIVNVSFEVDVFIDKKYDTGEVSNRIINLITDYMDIRKHFMGEDIFLGDLEKEISKLDGVLNLIELRCYNKVGDGYSDNEILQELASSNPCASDYYDDDYGNEEENRRIDLKMSDKLLVGDITTMFEIKYPLKDILVNSKTR